MVLLWDCLLTALAVLGLAILGCVLFGRLLHPVANGGVYLLLVGRGTGERLEGELYSILWLRSLGLLRCPVVIADGGLNEEGAELARRLTQRWSEVYLCPEERLEEYLIRK